MWWMSREILRDELLQVVLWRNGKLECPLSEFHNYFSKLTKERTEKDIFVYFNLNSYLKPEKCWIEIYDKNIMWENHGK